MKFTSQNRNYSTYKSPLTVIDSNTPKKQFNQRVFAALQSKGGFVLSNLDDTLSSTTTDLFTAYQDFLQQPNEVKNPFVGPSDSVHLEGFFPYKSFFIGSTACNRFFINQDNRGVIRQPLPAAGPSQTSMQVATTSLCSFTKQIIADTASALEIGLGLPNQQLTRIFHKQTLLTVVDSYLPVTQEKLCYWKEKGKLTKTKDGRVVMFLPHKDLMPFSALIYRGNQTHGLEVKTPDEDGKLSYKPLWLQSRNPYSIQVVVIAGLVIEHLTDGIVKGLEHRVVANPLAKGKSYKREAINSFVIIDADSNPLLKPLTTSYDGPHYSPIPMATFFETQIEVYNADAKMQTANTQLTAEDLAPFPREDEIETLTEVTGVSYRRR